MLWTSNTERYRDERFWQKQDRKLFPLKQYIDFNSASIGVTMRRLETEGNKLLEEGRTYKAIDAYRSEADDARRMVAELLHTSPRQLYFAENTTSALHRVLDTISSEGDILTTADEYGSMMLVMDNKYHKNVVQVQTDNIMKNLEERLTPNTKTIMVSHITHATCKILPVKEIADFARKRNVYCSVDAAQSIGQIPVNAEEIGADFVVGCGHKWLRGRPVSGILYSRRLPANKFLFSSPFSAPPHLRTSEDEESFIGYDGLGNAEGIAHLGKTLEVHKGYGWEHEYKRIQYLGEIMRSELVSTRKVQLENGDAPGMMSFRVNGKNQKDVYDLLEAQGIHVTFKRKENCIRVSVSPFNTVDEIRKFGRVIEGLA
jgi:selenocysteine lyase/cysteine desulfurase